MRSPGAIVVVAGGGSGGAGAAVVVGGGRSLLSSSSSGMFRGLPGQSRSVAPPVHRSSWLFNAPENSRSAVQPLMVTVSRPEN